MNHYAVMGNPIAHSLSPSIHQLFAQQTGIALQYDKIEVPFPEFEQYVIDFFHQPNSKGLNITLPFKERAFHLAQAHSARCIKACAANTLWMEKGVIYADNTDGVGLIRDLRRYIELAHQKILLLGAGGAARAVLEALLETGPKSLTVCNRTKQKAEALKRIFPTLLISEFSNINADYDIIINATSASLQDQTIPLSDSILANRPFCYDLAYNQHALTSFVQWARRSESPAMDGLGMLIEQAAEAFFIWHGVMPDTAPIVALFEKLKH